MAGVGASKVTVALFRARCSDGHTRSTRRAEGGRAQRWRATAAACPSRAVFVLGECGAKGPPVATGCFGRPISTWRLDALAVVERARAGFETGGEGTWSLLGRC